MMKSNFKFKHGLLVLIALITFRRAFDIETPLEKSIWLLAGFQVQAVLGLSHAAVEVVSNYERTARIQQETNISFGRYLGFRIGRRIVDYLVDHQAADDTYFYIQRRLFELVAIPGVLRLKADGYDYFDYNANGVPCRAVARTELIPLAKVALGLTNETADLEMNRSIKSLRWILQHHGGGYTSGTLFSGLDPGYHMGIHSQRRDNPFDLVAVIVDYGLAPEAVFPAAVVDAVKAFEWHVSLPFIDASRVALSGESAGGALVAATILALLDKNRLGDAKYKLDNLKSGQLPAAAVVMSPFIDVSHDTMGCTIREELDTITTKAMQTCARAYCPNATVAETDPLASPYLSNIPGAPPMYIAAGEYEIMYPKIFAFAQNVKEANPDQDIVFEHFDGMYHSFQLDWGDDCLTCQDLYHKAMDFVYEHTSRAEADHE